MNSVVGSLTIPLFVEYTNALIFGRYQFPPFIRTYPKSTSLIFFGPAGTQIGVKLLRVWQKWSVQGSKWLGDKGAFNSLTPICLPAGTKKLRLVLFG